MSVGSFSPIKIYIDFSNNSQSNIALCFVLLDKSILNLLHKLSKEFDDPGNLDLATTQVSIIFFLLSSFY